ncbi:MAG: hypothetical protein OXT67_08970 [Zetaproteobacteria bacterium]|nr:hypothetical protein [Zetaproteobacteria bacterium]
MYFKTKYVCGVLVELSLCLSVFVACRTRSQPLPGDDLYRTSFTGYNMEGDAQLCYQELHLDRCSPVAEDTSNFMHECIAKNYNVYRCSCTKFLCSFNIWGESP